MTSPQRPRAAATPTASSEGELDDLIARLELQAKTMDAHARSRRGQLWPGDNDYEDSARVMRAAAAALAAQAQRRNEVVKECATFVENYPHRILHRLGQGYADVMPETQDEIAKAMRATLETPEPK